MILLLNFLALIKKRQKLQLIGGFIGILAIPLLSLGLMHFGLIYAPITAAFIVAFVTYVMDVVLRFLYAEHDKRFLRQAFSTYLSKDIVDDLVNNPESLALGGSEKNVTALFSDIKSFSTLSEKLTAPQLVSVLNEYLTIMSDVILDNHGTIDKYIGDAIVSFFGAPMDVPDHAFKACASAIRMKQMEKKLAFESWNSGAFEVLSKGAEGNTIIYRLTHEGDDGYTYSQDYTVVFDRIPTLTSITVLDQDGTDQAATDTFSGDVKEYTYKVLDTTTSVSISATGLGADYVIAVNDQPLTEPITVPVNGVTDVEIVVSAGGYSNAYTQRGF